MVVPAIVHGVYHRHYEKELPVGDRIMSWASGFMAGFAAFLIALGLRYLA